MLSRAAPWSASRRSAAAPDAVTVRVLGDSDTAALGELAGRDPIANVFILAHLASIGTAAPTTGGASIFGVFDADTLVGACWSGANIVPIQMSPEWAGPVAAAASRSGRRFASAFGPADAVLALHSGLLELGHTAQELRAEQPLMVIDGPPRLAADPAVRRGTMADFERILPACAAMFEEEVGYSPFLGGRDFYSRRVEGLVRQGHSMVLMGPAGEVVFKAELGAVTPEVTQVQGVWMNPEYRGRGLGAAYMAAVVELAQEVAPVTSLYVNDYNSRARAVYQRVGFRTVGTFATVLF